MAKKRRINPWIKTAEYAKGRIVINGEQLTFNQLETLTNEHGYRLPKSTIFYRLRQLKLSAYDALTRPVYYRRSKRPICKKNKTPENADYALCWRETQRPWS